MARKPEEIEGSPERAADRGSPIGFTFFADETPVDLRYLGDPSAVENIVREFCIAVYEIRSDAGYGKISGPEALARLNALAARHAGIFYGNDSSYRSTPWHSPEGLGNFINMRLNMTDPPEEAAKTLFMNTANALLLAYNAHQEGKMSDDTVQFHLEAAVDDATRILLGLPPATAEDDEE